MSKLHMRNQPLDEPEEEIVVEALECKGHERGQGKRVICNDLPLEDAQHQEEDFEGGNHRGSAQILWKLLGDKMEKGIIQLEHNKCLDFR